MKRICLKCGWIGDESQTGFGHNDYFCPNCKIESLENSNALDICECGNYRYNHCPYGFKKASMDCPDD